MDHLSIKIFIDFVAQPADQYIHHISLGVKAVVIYMLQDGGLRNDAALVSNEIFQQGKLTGWEADILVTTFYCTGQEVNGQIARIEGGGFRFPGRSSDQWPTGKRLLPHL